MPSLHDDLFAPAAEEHQALFGERDERSAGASQLRIAVGEGKPIEAAFQLVEPPKVQPVEDRRGDLRYLEMATVKVLAGSFRYGQTPLPIETRVTLPGDDRPYAIDENRDSEYGVIWATLRLARTPLAQQFDPRRPA